MEPLPGVFSLQLADKICHLIEGVKAECMYLSGVEPIKTRENLGCFTHALKYMRDYAGGVFGKWSSQL